MAFRYVGHTEGPSLAAVRLFAHPKKESLIKESRFMRLTLGMAVLKLVCESGLAPVYESG